MSQSKTATQFDTTMTVITGIDIQSIADVNASITTFGDRYLRRLFSEHELEECDSYPGAMAEDLALRFAAKEAVIKVLRVDDHTPAWPTIEIRLRTPDGPEVVLLGEAEEMARDLGVGVLHLSVSVARESAVAAVVADTTRSAT